jgi:hypothetical protein
MAPADKKISDDDNADSGDIVPSALNDSTHAEVRMLYRESTETLRFIKNHQWRTVGATLLTFLGLISIAVFVKADLALTQKFMGITILMTASVIFTLIIYQFWMHNEQRKIDTMGEHMSSLFQEVRAIKSQREGNLHRYTLLIFMILTITLGAVVVHLAMQRIVYG